MKHRFSIPCQKSNLKKVRAFIKRYLAPLKIDRQTAHLIVLAIDEACANAIIHGNNCNDLKKIQIDLNYSNEELEVEIYDVGPAYPREAASSKIDWENTIEKKDKGGMGLIIMNQIMDGVEFFNRDELYVCKLNKKLAISSWILQIA